MYTLLLVLHLIVCICLVAVVLVQSGKGGGLAGGAFGGATQTVFGGRGATDFITRATIGLGIVFFVTSLSLALMTTKGSTGNTRSVLQEAARKAGAAGQTPAPGAPGVTPQAAPPTGAPATTPATTPAPVPATGGGK